MPGWKLLAISERRQLTPEQKREADRLCEAVNSGDLYAVQQLSSGANCSWRDLGIFCFPLLAAVVSTSRKAPEVALHLLSLGADLRQRDGSGGTVLHHAAAEGDDSAEMLQLLLRAADEAGAVEELLDAVDCRGATPLLLAVRARRPAAVAALVLAGADAVSAAVRGGSSPVEEAAAAGGTVKEALDSALLQLVRAGKVQQLQQVASASNCNLQLHGVTPLMAAAQLSDNKGAACAQLLLSVGADARLAGGADGLSPLHCAAESDSGEVALLLLQAGAEANAKDRRGDTPLMKAAAGDCRQAAEVLVSSGADLSITNDKGLTALQVAEAAGSDSVLQLLQEESDKFEEWQQHSLLGTRRLETKEVRRATTKTGLTLAVKTVTIGALAMEGEAGAAVAAAAQNEAKMLQQLQHPNIVRFVKAVKLKTGDLCIFTELVRGCTLSQKMHVAAQPLTEQQTQHYCAQLCNVLQYLHSRQPPVVHRDISGNNVMIDAADRVKLIDFELAVQLQVPDDGSAAAAAHVSRGICGTAHYLAPEICSVDSECRYSRQSDVWALGCIVFLMATGRVPHSHLRSLYHVANEIREKGAPSLPDSCSAQLRQFYSSCVAYDWRLRLTAAELLQLPFICDVSLPIGGSAEVQDSEEAKRFSGWDVKARVAVKKFKTVEMVVTDAGQEFVAKIVYRRDSVER